MVDEEFFSNTGWRKSHDTEKKLNISLNGLSKVADFFYQ
jgi:hypothetical protein